MEVLNEKWHVFKVGDEYLENVWEDYEEDEPNYTLTKQMSKAMKFRSLEGERVAPKYMWNEKTDEHVKTAQDMRDMFGGDFVDIVMVQTWEERTPTKARELREQYLDFNVKAIETFVGIKFEGTTLQDKEAFYKEHKAKRYEITSKLMRDGYEQYVKENNIAVTELN